VALTTLLLALYLQGMQYDAAPLLFPRDLKFSIGSVFMHLVHSLVLLMGGEYIASLLWWLYYKIVGFGIHIKRCRKKFKKKKISFSFLNRSRTVSLFHSYQPPLPFLNKWNLVFFLYLGTLFWYPYLNQKHKERRLVPRRTVVVICKLTMVVSLQL